MVGTQVSQMRRDLGHPGISRLTASVEFESFSFVQKSEISDLLLVASDVDVRALDAGVPGKVECPYHPRAQIDSRIYRRRG
jgi:hypothetical protein